MGGPPGRSSNVPWRRLRPRPAPPTPTAVPDGRRARTVCSRPVGARPDPQARAGDMTAPKPRAQFDLFIPLMRDLPLKDQRETMERPFFSLQKRKRLKPIEYQSADGEVRVKVEAVPAYGMATIWDADILIWAASSLNRLKAQGRNDLPRELRTTTYDLLRSIRRDTGGKGY